MPRVHTLEKSVSKKLRLLIELDTEYQAIKYKRREALGYCIEYTFLEGFKTWENFVENLFISHARYNDPVSGRRSYPFLAPKNEGHALELLTLERNYLDWTSPDNVISRAETCFRSHSVMTSPIKRSMQDLRDMKKMRNHIAHGSKETERIFKDLSRRRIGKVVSRPGDYLNQTSPDGINNYNVYYLDVLLSLVEEMAS